MFSDAAVEPIPGVTLDCASYDADLDPIKGATGSISIGVVRAKSADTPDDAGPLVMTTGSDLPTSVQLPIWLSRSGSDVLKTQPIVAVDRRGIGMSGALDCRDLFDRQEMLDQAQFQPGDDPVANLGAITQAATTSCTDTIAPGDSAYDNAHAAEDIERLRSTWDVPTLALLGVGNGAQVALAYAGSHPEQGGAAGARLPAAARHRRRSRDGTARQGRTGGAGRVGRAVRGHQLPVGCGPQGRDRRAAGGRARRPRAAVARRWPPSPTRSRRRWRIRAVTASPPPTGSASAIAGARSGDWNTMTTLITEAETLRRTDGQFVNSCSDALNRPTPDRVRELVVAWGKLYPQFGQPSARSNLVKCLNWPSGTPPRNRRI